ncbi:MAG: hypothetical protein U5K69_20390 [Balneolaceae bacterium]|nr:hypothetical protein [Balneolaceae bacterium]
MFNVFSKFLNLLESRFKVSEVLDFLSSSVIRQRFDISEDELNRLYSWIDETNIHWGLDGGDKAKMGLPSSTQFTWLYGLDRLMMGFSSQLEDETFDGIYPFEQVEGSDDANLLGKFSLFLNALQQARIDARAPQKMDRWVSLFSGWINSFIPSDGDYIHAYNGLKRVVDDLQQASSLAEVEHDLEYIVLLDYLDDKLSMAASRGGYYGHGITFSGLEQMRNIPRPVIGMIGMNNEAFPRTKLSPDFDLMTRNSQPGDRSRRNDDRYLFLEEMQSARDYFYLSYIGQSNRDDSKRPPSVMISELADFMRDLPKQEEDLEMQHPLQPYSRKYFTDGESKLFSYSRSMYTVSKTISGEQQNQPLFFGDGDRLPEADATFTRTSLKELVQFFEHPCRFLVQNRLGIDFREEDIIDEDREPFQLGGLRNYQLGQELLDRTLAEKPIVNYGTIARARGILPDGWPGHEAFREKIREITEYSEKLKQLLASEKMASLEVDLDLERYHLSGLLDSMYSRLPNPFSIRKAQRQRSAQALDLPPRISIE